jgi:hypothetical protein
LIKARPVEVYRKVYYQLGVRVQMDITGTTGTTGTGTTGDLLSKVYTLNGSLASIPMDVGVKHFRASGDPRVGALYCAEACDYVNAQIVEQQHGTSDCGCDLKMSKQITHHCHGCLKERPCATLLVHDGSRVCKVCLKRLGSKSSNTNVSVIMRRSIRRTHERECRVLDKDPGAPAEQRRLRDMIINFDDHYRDHNSYADDYASMDRKVSGVDEVHAGGRDPFNCSLDAIEPYGRSHDGTMRVHTKNNAAMSTTGYNYTKWIHLIAFLVEFGDYDPSIRHHTWRQKRAFELLCDDIYRVTMKTPFTKKARLQGRGLNDLDADQKEWRQGKPIDEEGPWRQGLWHWSLRGVPNTHFCEWDEETVTRLDKLAKEIQLKFGKHLHTAKDGAPWITGGDGRPPPENWSWGCWAVAMRQRLDRMTRVCNRHGIS